jgi:3-hydroxyisobutyrate dehydrogenase-like beta-hydroxyacid dehydrogenase
VSTPDAARVTAVGLLHPGEMGAALGAVAAAKGHRVLWASAGRSEATVARARGAGFEDVGSVPELARRSEVAFSVCPPHAAAEVAASVGSFDGIYVDANAIAPATTRQIGAGLARYVDGGIIGPPPSRPGTTRLYLSGPEARSVAELFEHADLEPRVLSETIGDASALKMVYAAWTKGTAALLLAVRDVARAQGVEDALRHEWELSLPQLPDRLAAAQVSADAKGWRWVAEMEEIAATFAASGNPDGFHQSAAEIFRRDTPSN